MAVDAKLLEDFLKILRDTSAKFDVLMSKVEELTEAHNDRNYATDLKDLDIQQFPGFSHWDANRVNDAIAAYDDIFKMGWEKSVANKLNRGRIRDTTK